MEAKLCKERAAAHAAKMENVALKKELEELKASNIVLSKNIEAANNANKELRDTLESINKQYALLSETLKETQEQMKQFQNQIGHNNGNQNDKYEDKILTLTTEKNDLNLENQKMKIRIEQFDILASTLKEEAMKARQEADEKIKIIQQQMQDLQRKASPVSDMGPTKRRREDEAFPPLPRIPSTPLDTPDEDNRQFFPPLVHTPQPARNSSVNRPAMPPRINVNTTTREANRTIKPAEKEKTPPPVIVGKDESWTALRAKLMQKGIKFLKAQTTRRN